MKASKIMFVVGGMFLLIGVMLFIFTMSTMEYSNDLDCYDRYGNKIQELKCSGEVYNDIGVIGLLFFMFGFMILAAGMVTSFSEDL
ncbi:hypothetical protein LCGC14_1295960 [marine sediment metagenome]|uniref:Uncharacterized protein n=1 Tax=marine sediment metagenome TaxID=412755 RepID=A0A0F9NTU9_9ZZZZ